MLQKETFCRAGDERALLNCIIKNSENFYSAGARIRSDDFLDDDHRLIFVVLNRLIDKGVDNFDLPIIINEAINSNLISNKDQIDYLKSIYDMSVSSSNFDILLNSVTDASSKYKIGLGLERHLELLVSNARSGYDSEYIIGEIENYIMGISVESMSLSEPRDLKDGLMEYLLEKKNNPVKLMGLSTGFPILDNQIDGLVKATLTVIAARKKVGKSTLLSNIAAHVAYREKVPTLYVDTEMTFDEWRDRVLAMLSKIKERTIKHGGYSDSLHSELVEKCVRIVENGKLFHEYMPGYDVNKLVALYKKYKVKENIGLAIFDYLKEPQTTDSSKERREHQILGDVTTKLKDVAGILDIPVLTAIQLGRSGDIADSDRVARYGDVVAFWMKYESEQEQEATGPNFERGSHKLVIKDSRRGGMTSDYGIGYTFHNEILKIEEVPLAKQIAGDFISMK